MTRVAWYALLVLMQACQAAVGAEPAGTVSSGDAPPPAASVRVDRIVFRGNKALALKSLQAVAARYLGRTLTAAQVEELRERLTRAYTDRGYVNSGVVLDSAAPAENGVLHFLAIEGHLKDVRIRGLKRLHPAYVIDRLRHGSGEVLNVNVLRERFQRLLDDPLFTRINSRIVPGEQPGEATLDMDVERARPYALSVALNNYRPPSIDEKGYEVAGLVRDLTGWGDVLDADVSGALNGTGGVNYSAGWQIPFTSWFTLAAIRGSHSDSVVTEEPLEALDIRSRVARQEFRLTQPLWASLREQFNLAAGVAYEKDTTSLAGVPFSLLPGAVQGVTRALAVRVAPDFSFRTAQQYLGVRLTLLRATLLGEPAGTAAFGQPAHEYLVSTAQLHHLLELPKAHLELETHATVQWTGAIISDLHALEVGGIGSVRGFRENELLLSNVRNLNFDLRWLALPLHGARPGLTLGPFFDWASGHDVRQPETTFSSTGVTLRAKWTHVQADFAFGARLIRPEFVKSQHGSWQDHGIHAQILAAL